VRLGVGRLKARRNSAVESGSATVKPAKPAYVDAMVVAFVPGAARDESHRELPIIQRERAVNRVVIELNEQLAEPVNASLELTE